jgi:hypothetical protein
LRRKSKSGNSQGSLGKIRKEIRKEFKGDLRRTQGEFKKGFFICDLWNLEFRSLRLQSNFKRDERNFATDLCSPNTNKTQT